MEGIFLSSIILISPYFRSYAIWAGDINLALLFLLCSILFFFKLKKEKKIEKKNLYIVLHVVSLAISAYIRPIYSLISIYFFYKIIKRFGLSKETSLYITTNILLSLPAFYYVYGLDIVFFENRILLNINLISTNISHILVFYFHSLSCQTCLLPICNPLKSENYS